MTPFTRHIRDIKEKLADLVDELSSFFRLIVMTLVEALYLFLFGVIHQHVDNFFHDSPWCPMKVAAVAIGFSFLILNVLIVLGFVTLQAVATVRTVRATFGRERRTVSTELVQHDGVNYIRPRRK